MDNTLANIAKLTKLALLIVILRLMWFGGDLLITSFQQDMVIYSQQGDCVRSFIEIGIPRNHIELTKTETTGSCYIKSSYKG